MFRRVVKHEAPRPRPRGRRIERFIQGTLGVRVQVIVHHMHHCLIAA
jgi:hypothetical protein